MTTRYYGGPAVLLGSPWRGAVAGGRGRGLGYARRLCCRRSTIGILLSRGSLFPGGDALGPSTLGMDDERVPNSGAGTYVSLAMGTAHADGLGLIALAERRAGGVEWGGQCTHLDFFDATGETACLTSGIFGTLPLLWFVAGLDVTAGVRWGVVGGGGDVGISGGRAGGREGVSGREGGRG